MLLPYVSTFLNLFYRRENRLSHTMTTRSEFNAKGNKYKINYVGKILHSYISTPGPVNARSAQEFPHIGARIERMIVRRMSAETGK
jgi:hypothetical protein